MVTYEYISLEDVLYKVCSQAKKGVNYMGRKIPSYITTAEQLFIYLSGVTSYRDDPPGAELIQSPESIFKNNYWGVSGMGDCDCFTVLGIASALAIGFPISSLEIVLAGNSRNIPKHIYLTINKKPFDLTNAFFNTERNYPFLQHIPVSKLWR
jgi:hypothetical protein